MNNENLQYLIEDDEIEDENLVQCFDKSQINEYIPQLGAYYRHYYQEPQLKYSKEYFVIAKYHNKQKQIIFKKIKNVQFEDHSDISETTTPIQSFSFLVTKVLDNLNDQTQESISNFIFLDDSKNMIKGSISLRDSLFKAILNDQKKPMKLQNFIKNKQKINNKESLRNNKQITQEYLNKINYQQQSKTPKIDKKYNFQISSTREKQQTQENKKQIQKTPIKNKIEDIQLTPVLKKKIVVSQKEQTPKFQNQRKNSQIKIIQSPQILKANTPQMLQNKIQNFKSPYNQKNDQLQQTPKKLKIIKQYSQEKFNILKETQKKFISPQNNKMMQYNTPKRFRQIVKQQSSDHLQSDFNNNISPVKAFHQKLQETKDLQNIQPAHRQLFLSPSKFETIRNQNISDRFNKQIKQLNNKIKQTFKQQQNNRFLR